MTVLSDCSPRPVQRELLLKEACKMNPFNYPAWRRYLSMKAKGINDRQKLTLLKELAAGHAPMNTTSSIMQR